MNSIINLNKFWRFFNIFPISECASEFSEAKLLRKAVLNAAVKKLKIGMEKSIISCFFENSCIYAETTLKTYVKLKIC